MHTDHLSKVISEALNTVTQEDIALYRGNLNQQIITRSWLNEKLDEDGEEEKEVIDAIVTVQTSVIEDIKIPVTFAVVKHQIFTEEIIDFGTVQIGSQKSRNLNLYNPFNETIFVNIFVGRNTIQMIDQTKRINDE